MGLELLICRLLPPPFLPPPSALLPADTVCFLWSSISQSVFTLDSKEPGVFLPFSFPLPPPCSFLPPICLFGMMPFNHCEAASCCLCSELQETLLISFKKRSVTTKERRQRRRTLLFYRPHQHLCTYVQIKGLPRGMKSFTFLRFSIRVLMKRTSLFVAALVESLIQRALVGMLLNDSPPFFPVPNLKYVH